MSLRSELEALRSEELDAFLIDCFPDVYRELSSKATRAGKINELIDAVGAAEALTTFAGWISNRAGRKRPTTILALVSSPDGTANLQTLQEISAIEDAIARSKHRSQLTLVCKPLIRPEDVRLHLNGVKPPVVLHIVTHGVESGLLLLQDDRGNPAPADPAALAELVHLADVKPSLVVLNACHSIDQARALAERLGCAIGVDGPIEDQTAIHFAAALYRLIGDGCSIERALDVAKVELRLRRCHGVGAIELVQRSPAGGKPGSRALVGDGH